MSVRSRVRTWWKAIFHAGDLHRQVSEELQFHIDAQADDLVGRGMNRDEAVRRARPARQRSRSARERPRSLGDKVPG